MITGPVLACFLVFFHHCWDHGKTRFGGLKQPGKLDAKTKLSEPDLPQFFAILIHDCGAWPGDLTRGAEWSRSRFDRLFGVSDRQRSVPLNRRRDKSLIQTKKGFVPEIV